MRKITMTAAIGAAALPLLLLAAAAPQSRKTPAKATATPTAPAGSTSNCLAPPFVVSTDPAKHGYTTPKDFALTRQADANCFAWQEFISLSWAASAKMRGQPDVNAPTAKFGAPLDVKPVVWETYKESNEVFLPDAANPGAWNGWPSAGSVKLLGGMKSEVDRVPALDLSDVGQASEGHPWLTAQSRLLTLYERRMNEDEFNYIVRNDLYNAVTQQTFVLSPGISLPDGTATSAAYGPLGAIETKAAWIELRNKKDWPRYKISRADIRYPDGTVRKNAVVGLVGLHIIHKTALGQQFIWATFEHRDNCPNRDEVASHALRTKYTFYNPKCDPKTDYYQCSANANPATYKGAQTPNPYGAPIQVVRETPIASRPNDDVTGLNRYAWNQIKAANPKSVYLNYELVNTLWSNQSTTIPPGARTPLFAGQLSPGPSQEPVANATLETYVQSLTCLTCHASAPVARVQRQASITIFDPAKPAAPANPYASDYSFLLGSAQQPKGGTGNR
jgi:hypothetical protein